MTMFSCGYCGGGAGAPCGGGGAGWDATCTYSFDFRWPDVCALARSRWIAAKTSGCWFVIA